MQDFSSTSQGNSNNKRSTMERAAVPALDLNRVGRQLGKELLSRYDVEAGDLLFGHHHPHHHHQLAGTTSARAAAPSFTLHATPYNSAATYRSFNSDSVSKQAAWGTAHRHHHQQHYNTRFGGGYHAAQPSDGSVINSGWPTARPVAVAADATGGELTVHGHAASARGQQHQAGSTRHQSLAEPVLPIPQPVSLASNVVVKAQQHQQTPYSPPTASDYSSPTSSAISSSTTFNAGGTPKSSHPAAQHGHPFQQPGLGSSSPALTAALAVRQYMGVLTEFEQAEIFDYRHVYFVGQGAKKIRGSPAVPALNYGYDDDKGDYRVVAGDHVAYRYEVKGVLGKGSFGQVMRVRDHKSGQDAALKIIRNKKRFHSQAQVEVEILQRLVDQGACDAAGVVRMQEHFYFRGHLCIVFELLGSNLYDYLKANEFSGIPLSAVRHIATQVLRSMVFLRSQRVIHCDIKPENILLRARDGGGILESYDVTLIDFGSSCYEGRTMYTYIQSRFYRAPEVILGLPYSAPIDVWSLACVLAELVTGYPLFPGDDEQQQLLCMMEVLGVPPRRMLETASRATHFFDALGDPIVVPSARGQRRFPGTQDLATAAGSRDPTFLSFLRACLEWEPAARLTPEQALAHPFITGGSAVPSTPTLPTPRQYRAPGSTHRAHAAGNGHHAHAGGGYTSILPTPRKAATTKPAQGIIKKAAAAEPSKRLRSQVPQTTTTTSLQQQQQQPSALPMHGLPAQAAAGGSYGTQQYVQQAPPPQQQQQHMTGQVAYMQGQWAGMQSSPAMAVSSLPVHTTSQYQQQQQQYQQQLQQYQQQQQQQAQYASTAAMPGTAVAYGYVTQHVALPAINR